MVALGSSGPHPDIHDLLVASVTDAVRQQGFVIQAQQFTILQQRTFYNQNVANKRVTGPQNLTTCLAILDGAPVSTSRSLVLLEAAKIGNPAEWRMIGSTAQPMGDPPLKPYTTIVSVAPETGVTLGLWTDHPDIVRLRIELADGTVAEDSVANHSMLLTVPFESSDAWVEDATVRIQDRAGREIVASRIYVNPKPPPDLSIPRSGSDV